MLSDSQENEEKILENRESEEDSLKQYKGPYKKNVCSEILYKSTLNPTQLKNYKTYQEKSFCSCLTTPLSLLIYCIIVAIFVAGGIYFNLGKNEGYNAYKEVLERNISYIEKNNKFPNEKETLKLIKYLSRNKSEDSLCPYLLFSLDKCNISTYIKYCNNERYKEKKCNYMDRKYYLGHDFICDENNFKKGLCDEIQYNDYLYMEEPYEKKISYKEDKIDINLTSSLYFAKLWIYTGNYVYKIYIVFSILLVIFILFLIYNLIMIKKNLEPGINYYIIITFYMIYYIIFKIYVVLFCLSFFGSFFVIFAQIKHPINDGGNLSELFLNKYFVEQKMWEDEKINAIIFSGITFVLFFMIIFISNLKKIIHNYLSFKFDEKNINKDILRKTSIKIGDNIFEFKLLQNKNIYLRDNRKNIKYNFKEILFENNTYYLKCRNECLKDQLSWADLIFPQSNIIFDKVLKSLEIIILIAYALIGYSYILQDEIGYDYYYHLLDLGYKPKYYTFIQISNNLNYNCLNSSSYIFIGLGILCLLLLYLRAIFGGFSNIILLWSKIIFSIIFALIILAIFIISIIVFVCEVFAFISALTEGNLNFVGIFGINTLLYMNVYAYLIFNFILLFIMWIGIIPPLFKIINDKSKLESIKNTSEHIFYFVSLDNKSYILEAVESINLPGNLFYKKILKSNSINLDIKNLGQELDITTCLERNYDDICDEKHRSEIRKYNYQDFSTIKNLFINILVILTILILSIVSLKLSFKHNKYYNKLSDYFTELDKDFNKITDDIILDELGLNSILPSYTQFWCRVGIFEKNTLISLIICSALYLSFQLFSILVHKNCKGKLNYNNGKNALYYSLIVINGIFVILFHIFYPLLLFLFLYSLHITIWAPNNKIFQDSSWIDIYPEPKDLINGWKDNKMSHFINIPIKFILFLIIAIGIILRFKYLIIDYLNMNYQENDNDGKENNGNEDNIELNEKRTSIIINNNSYNVRIKLNHILYLQQIDNNKIHKFKKILIENITNNFVYVRLGNNSITDQISHAQWNYPNINYIFEILSKMCFSTYMILEFSVILFECNLQNNLTYRITTAAIGVMKKITSSDKEYEKPKFSSIYEKYGLFEEAVNNTRFTFYTIQVGVLLLIMVKRMLFGGFRKIIYANITYIYSIYLILQNIIFVLIDFLNILFAIFSIVCYYITKSSYRDSDIRTMIILHVIWNIAIVIFNIKLLIQSIKFRSYMKKLKTAAIKFEEKQDNIDDEDINFKPVEFKFVSLEGIICSIKEYINPNLQRYLYYYDLDENKDNMKNQHISEVLDIRTNTIDNNNIINKNYMNETKNILENDTNNVVIEMKNTVSGDM